MKRMFIRLREMAMENQSLSGNFSF
jgi:hypothetical protein